MCPVSAPSRKMFASFLLVRGPSLLDTPRAAWSSGATRNSINPGLQHVYEELAMFANSSAKEAPAFLK